MFIYFLKVWRNRCAISGRRIGGCAPLVLGRWNPEEHPNVGNLVLMTQSEAQKLELNGQGSVDKDIAIEINRRLTWAKSVFEDIPTIKATMQSTSHTASVHKEDNRSWVLCASATLTLFGLSTISKLLI